MIKSGEKIPFDISGMRTICFDTQDIELADDAEKMLKEQVESIDKGNFKAVNPITLARNSSILQKALSEDVSAKESDPTRLILESLQSMNANMGELRREITDVKAKQSDLAYTGLVHGAPSFIYGTARIGNELLDDIYVNDNINDFNNKIVNLNSEIANLESELQKPLLKKQKTSISMEIEKKRALLNSLKKEREYVIHRP